MFQSRDGQGGLVCCNSWGHRESDTTEQLNWTEVYICCHQVMSNSLQPHGLQHTRAPCPSPSPRVCPSSCPLSHWYHPNISSSCIPFSSCLQSFPTSRSFPVSWLFTSGGQNIATSASVLPINIQGWFPLGLTPNFISSVIDGHVSCFCFLAIVNTAAVNLKVC